MLGVLLVVLAGVSLVQLRSAYSHLHHAEATSRLLVSQLKSGDRSGLRASAGVLRRDTGAAREAMDGWQWSLLSRAPWVGGDVEVVQTVSEVADDLASDTLTDLLDVSEEVQPSDLRPVDGRVSLEPIRAAGPGLAAAAASARRADERLSRLDLSDVVVGRVRAPASRVVTAVHRLRSATDTAARASKVLPEILGANGPRNVLLLAQNNSEPRSLGGIAGSVIHLRTDRGRVKLVEQRPGGSFGDFGSPVLPLSAAERKVFGVQLGRYMVNVTDSPDFPRGAALAARMWQLRTGERVDAVGSIDPLAIRSMLRATGPVPLARGGSLTEANAAQLLLNQVYLDVADPAAQDRFFAKASGALFDKILTGGVDVPVAAQALGTASDQGRLLFWARDPEVQAQLDGTAVAGQLRGHVGASPVVGVYLHDRTQAKLAYYEDMRVRAVTTSCRRDGSRVVRVTVRVSSKVPPNVTRLPRYLTGLGDIVPVGQLASQVYFVAPSGSEITGFGVSPGDRKVVTATYRGLALYSKALTLKPGESVTLDYVVQIPARLGGPVLVRTTPGPSAAGYGVSIVPCHR